MITIQEYITNQSKCELKIGDRVKVIRKTDTNECGWGNSWVSRMDRYIGTSGVITGIYSNGIKLEHSEEYRFPYFVLANQDKSP